MPEPEPEPEKRTVWANLCWLLLVLAGIAGGGAYFWLKMQQKKREAEENSLTLMPITVRTRMESFCPMNLTPRAMRKPMRTPSAGRIRAAMGTRRNKTG